MYLWAQRVRWPVPDRVRQLAASTLVKGLRQTDVPVLDPWSKPIAGLANGDPGDARRFTAAIGDVSQEPYPFAPAPAPKLRCVVVNGVAGIGGLDKVATQLARYLPAQAIDTILVAPDDQSEDHCGSSSQTELPRGETRLAPRNFTEWLRVHRPDVISLHGTSDWVIQSAAELGVPVVETLHGAHSFFDADSWAAERRRSQKVASFVAVSELVRRQYLRANPDYPAERIVTIPNGVEGNASVSADRSAARAKLGLRDQFLFVSLARYSFQKNTFGLIQAFGDLAGLHPDVHLLVAGPVQDNNYCRQVLRLRDTLPHSDRIHLRANCEDTATLLAAADAFVLDSFFEGWALASMEALAAGLPIVMSEVGGAREQIGEDGTRGILVPNPLGDPEAMDWRTISRAMFRGQTNRAQLVEAMSEIVRRREHWSRVRAKLQKEAMMRFPMERFARRHAYALAQAAANTPQKSRQPS
jgi:glycosyltransferase involved in cell wall biosynthesis